MFRWSQGLILHQAFIDSARAAILLPMGKMVQHINSCLVFLPIGVHKEDGPIEERSLWTTRILRQIGHHARHF